MKRFTVEEANALLPRVGARLARLREELTGLRFAEEQVQDLRQMWGLRIEDPSCSDHQDYRRYVGEAALYGNRAKDTLAELGELGVEVKDPWTGLVDFHGERSRGGEVVYLCWKEGEPRITHWHPLQGGFAARRPIEEL
ncbi:MAG TPA: DUF2203 domain-containing protein [Candidatus Thermoplasmatota archaeon]|nr:DUF2203 domain-containing protein [Candidatus Thermoplasmatota archaeon]